MSNAQTFAVSLFKHKRDNAPVDQTYTWPELAHRLSTHRVRATKDGPLFSPAQFQGRRALENVQDVSLLVLDYDHDATLPQVLAAFAGLDAVIYSSFSHTPENERYRAVVRLSEPVSADVWPRFWEAAAGRYGASTADRSCKDASRIYYFPACPPEQKANRVFQVLEGAALDPNSLELPEPEVLAPPLPLIIPNDADGARRYALKALESGAHKIATELDDSRHVRRRNEAIAIAGFIPTGALSESEVEETLIAAALSNTTDKVGAAKTIRDGIKMGMARPRQIPESNYQKTPMLRGRAVRAWIGKKGADVVEAEAAEEDAQEEIEQAGSTAGAYRLQYGRTHLVVVKESTGKDNASTKTEITPVVWDGAAHIAEEITGEDGTTIFKIEGRTKQGRCFSLEMDAAKFSEPRRVLAALSNVAGANCVFAAGMEKHLAPAIKSFTSRDTLEYGRRFKRVGWHKTPQGWEFLVPGREAEHTTIELNRKLPYHISPLADLDKGLQVLGDLFNAQKVEATTVATVPAFQAPLARLAGWVNERSVMFIDGRTGSFKSSWAMVMMALWGADFDNEDSVLKMGEGGTNVARMRLAVCANDVPLLFDNYKPNTGKGAPELVAMIHQMIEGGEKDRGTQDGGLRETSVVHCWPVFTGEDFPDSEASTAARCLIVNFPYTGLANAPLASAQDGSFHLSAVMGAWLDWLQDETNAPAILRVASRLTERRGHWAQVLRELRPDMANINRVATNLATNELTWQAMTLCPVLNEVCREFAQAHQRGLDLVAASMSRRTSESSEANRFLGAIKALLSGSRAAVVDRDHDFPEDTKGVKYLGWQDGRGVYLILKIVMDEVQKLLRESGGLNGMSEHALTRQLEQIGAIAQKGTDGVTRPVRCGSDKKLVRVLHLKPECLEETPELEPVIEGNAEVF